MSLVKFIKYLYDCINKDVEMLKTEFMDPDESERRSRMDCRHRRKAISISHVNTAHQLCILVYMCI